MRQEDGKTGSFLDCSAQVIGACIDVHRALGPGLLESAYEECLAHELSIRNLRFKRQVPVRIHYKGLDIEHGYRLDFLVEDELIVELKATDRSPPVYIAQLLTYLRLTGIRAGLLVNFGYETLRRGIRRLTLK
jgi:GxxExxY protein